MISRAIQQFQSGKFVLTGQWDGPGTTGGAGKLPAAIFCHGFTGNRLESRRMFARLSARLAEHGLWTFRFDHRGCGESEGDFQDFTADGLLEDLRQALEVFVGNDAVDLERTAVVGYSLGGLSANYLLSLRPEFQTGVLWAPVAQPDIIRDRLAAYPDFINYKTKGYFDYMGNRVAAGYIDEIGKLDPLAWTIGYRRPILIAQGGIDPVVKPEQAKMYMESRANPEDRLLLVPDGDHFFGSSENIELVLDESENWLRHHLKQGSTT